MAAMIASRRGSAKLLEKLLFPSAARPVQRSFNTQMSDYGDDQSLQISDVEAASSYRRPLGDDDLHTFSDPFDPFFGPTRSLRKVLDLDNMMEKPFVAWRRGAATRRGWEAKEDKDALYLRIDMPGLGKEHVRVSAEQDTLIINGEGEKTEAGEEESVRRYSSRVDLPPELYKMDQIRAEMKNGVLKVTVPKVKEEERKDVFNVQIE